MKRAALVSATLATLGVYVADLLLLGVPAFRNGWWTLPLFLVPLALLLAGRGEPGRLAVGAWALFLVAAAAYPALRLLVGVYPGEVELKAGARAPNFTLKDQDGNEVSLSDFTDDHRALLVFIRSRG